LNDTPSPSRDRSTSPASERGRIRFSAADTHLSRARTSLRQALNRYSQRWFLGDRRSAAALEMQAVAKRELDQLSHTLEKVNTRLVKVAVFGLVSRGKSAVLNALMGQKLLQTGPTHGVTQWARSVMWSLETPNGSIPVELIDTPGLDEIDGQARAELAREVAYQADLILFVIAGDLTRTEYLALTELQSAHKPLLLVFNKTDLYPDRDRASIYAKLQDLLRQERKRPLTAPEPALNRPFLLADDIVRVAAEPSPVEVRVEYPDGRVEYEWESVPPNVEELRSRLVTLLQQEGQSLLALNALRQARDTERAIARKTLQVYQDEADALIWNFAKWKGLVVALNPIAILDVLGGAVIDLVLIRSLARLYGLPMTSHEARKLMNAILWSSGSLALGEIGSSLFLGVGKSGAAIASAFDSASGLAAYTSAAAAQAALAGYGAYRLGSAAQVYLEQGCTWGMQGADTVIRDILAQVDSDTILHRLQHELQQALEDSQSLPYS
jgi:small GTP-binding protein